MSHRGRHAKSAIILWKSSVATVRAVQTMGCAYTEKNERGPRHRATAYSYKYIMVSRLKLDFKRARALSSQHTVIVGESLHIYAPGRHIYGVQLKDIVPPVPNPTFD